MAEASFEQARKGFEKFLAGAQAIAGSTEPRGAMSYAEANVRASLDYGQALLRASGLPEVMRLHREFVRAQMRSLAEQAAKIGQLVAPICDRGHKTEKLIFVRFLIEFSGSERASSPGLLCGIAP
jgi:hypothetical protein